MIEMCYVVCVVVAGDVRVFAVFVVWMGFGGGC